MGTDMTIFADNFIKNENTFDIIDTVTLVDGSIIKVTKRMVVIRVIE